MQSTSRLAALKDDAGYALAMVLGIGLVLMLMIVTATTYSISGFQATRSDQDWNGALAAAYAGVDEYQARLAGDSSYGQYGNDKAAFSIATNSVVRAPASSNPAFSVTAGGTWGSVVGSDGKASFRYEVDNSNFASYGQLRLRVTGKVGIETRSIVANLKGKGFIDFLYFTDYEIADPILNLNPDTQLPTCADPKHAWEVSGFRTGCTEITFGSGDRLEGPVHSNDVMHICDATFTGSVTSAYSVSPYYSATTGRSSDSKIETCSGQNFQGGVPTNDDTVTMPATNNALLDETAVNLPNTVPRPGCLYTGPTSIEFFANGTMRVISPWTKYTQRGAKDATPSLGVTKTTCGTPGATGLGATNGQIIPIPADNLIFVQEPPADTADPNYWAANKNPASSPKNAENYRGCVGSNSNSDSSKGQKEVSGNGIGYPTSGNVTVSNRNGTRTRIVNESPPASNAYGCRAGDVFVKGVVHGRVTVASSNYLYVAGDITYTNPADAGTDMLGLIGGKAVWVWDPLYSNYSSDNWTYTQNTFVYGDANRTIQAAILSVENTFTVQNYNKSGAGGGRRGDLIVMGAIAQKYRGVVSQAGGYKKSYKYDRRYITAAPPKFLAPVSTSYGVSSYADVKVAFRPDGTPQ